MPDPKDKPKRGPRARAVIVQRNPWLPPHASEEFKGALLEDMRELVQAMGLVLVGPPAGATGPDLRALVEASREPVLVLFSDVAALPPLSVEGALDSLQEYSGVIGPCTDGSLYLLGFSPGMDQKLKVALLEAATVSPAEALDIATDLLCDDEVDCSTLPPWFRVASERSLRFTENLIRLSLLSDEGEDDIVCDRLRLWFERHDIE